MSGIPPTLYAQPGTPAGEWAAKTTSALHPENPETATTAALNPTTAQLFEERNMRPGAVAEETFANQSVVSTPGNEFPGAYPRNQETKPAGSEIVSAVSDTASRVAQSVQQTAQIYVPVAAEKIGQYLPKSVADKVSQYTGMPNPQGTVIASEHDQPHFQSLPSTELTGAGAREHVGGAGALPGPITESGVTRLPEERNTSAEYPTIAGATVIAKEKAQNAAQSVQNTTQQTKDRVIGNTHATAVTGSTLPSREWDGARPGDHSSGVGALPGPVGEPGVALLPDEGGRGVTNATSAGVGTHARVFGGASLPSHDDEMRDGVSGGVGSLPGRKDESSVALLPDERAAEGRDTGAGWKKDAEYAGAGAAAAGMGTWALHGNDKDQVRGGLNPKTAEDTAMADAARTAGVRSADTQQPITKQEQKQDGNARAGAVGAAVGEQYAKDHQAHKDRMAQDNTPREQTKQEQKQEGKAGAAAIGAAAGEKYAKDHHDNKDEKKADKGSTRKPEGMHAEKQADLTRVKLNPRSHALGSEGAQWGGVDISGTGYRHGVGVDLDKGDSYGADYHPAELHPASEEFSKEHAKQESQKETVGEKEQEAPLTGAKHADSKTDSHASGTGSATDDNNHEEGGEEEQSQGQKAKKVGFMAKMKGEALVLLGKVEGKKGHDKVEKGQQLKAGEDVSTH